MRALHLLQPKRERVASNWYPWLIKDMFRTRISRGKNVVIIVEGDTGSGKSSASMRIAYDGDIFWRRNPIGSSQMFVVFSARELNILIALLVNVGLSKEDWSIFMGRFLVAEEAESNTILQAGAVQDLIENVQVFRKYVINVVFNMPFSDDLRELKRKVAHYVVWLKDYSDTHMCAYGEVLCRYRYRNLVYFVHPHYRKYLFAGFYPPQYAKAFSLQPGGRIIIPFCPKEVWESYEKQKDMWFATKSIIVLKRMRRLSKIRGDLGAYVARPSLITLEKKLTEELGTYVREKMLRLAEKQRALTGNEKLVDIVQDILDIDEKDIQILDIDEKTREILRLRLLKGLNLRKIAQRVGLAHPSVHQRILKVARKLGLL